VAGSVTLPPKDLRRVSNFTIRVRLVRASEAEKMLVAASSTAPVLAVSTPVKK
jgi:type IV pilus assembly protein PilN